MTDTAILIMAAGEASRWHLDTPKHLIEVWDGELVIGRIGRQVKARGYHPTIISHHLHLYDFARQHELDIHAPMMFRWLAETMLSTQSLWQQRTVILLGDVVYLKATMDAILADERPLSIYANVAEVFALTFNEDGRGRVEEALRAVIQHAEKTKRGDGVGKLWNIYRFLAGYPLTQHYHDFKNGILRGVWDWTCDFDSHEQYQRWVKNCVHQGLLDDLPITV